MEDQSISKEQEIKNALLFTLSKRDTGTVAIVVTNSEQHRRQLQLFLKEHLKEYHFYDLDLTSQTYTSLYRALDELLPEKIKQIDTTQGVINISGLENSIYKTKDGKLEYTSLIAQLNFERELLFKQPQILIIWANTGFYNELKNSAPDLMHWLAKRFVFSDTSLTPEQAENELQKPPLLLKGKIKERTQRIEELEKVWVRLTLDHDDRQRLQKDKISILLALGKEYKEVFDFAKSEDALKKALEISHKIQSEKWAEIAFELGNTYYFFREYSLALDCYKQSLDAILKQNKDNFLPSIYHQIGMVYEAQGNLRKALDNYHQSLDWSRKVGHEHQLGNTYHQIGMVYQRQKNWNEALINYHNSIIWNTQTKSYYGIGATYHQIGTVYHSQKNWLSALENYQTAIDWKVKTGNEYELGTTYSLIGMVNEEQGNFTDALANYHKALEWNTSTGNEYELGHSYLRMGRLYDQQKNFHAAKHFFEKAVDNLALYNHKDLPEAKDDLKRINELISTSTL